MAPTPLSTMQLKAIAFIEKYWHTYHKLPASEDIEEEIPAFFLDLELEKSNFVKALENRGISLSKTPRGLSEEQVAAVLCLSDFEDKRTRSRKLRELGISTTKWNGWLKQDSFKKFLHGQFSFNFDSSSHIAQESLVKAMDRGDTNAIKFYMEMSGQYTPNTPQTVNVKIILARVVESIQRHVRDPEVLKAISNDFESIMRGDSPVDNTFLQIEGVI